MTTDQKEKRNDEYNKYVKRVTPTHCLSANMQNTGNFRVYVKHSAVDDS